MKKIVIMRGVSGSGKSTKAKEIIKEAIKDGCWTSIICSADQFFIDPKSGRYEFDARKLGSAHAFCRAKVEAAVELEANLIIVDNTNTQKWEFAPYIAIAEANDYECEEIMVGTLNDDDLKAYANRNKHGVPLESIRKMAKRFQL
ncbi:MAG: AAA family ATPase [Promethearchaeota archaeon]|jgi:tRNA uridine 5-carbamoylmethylation protein Kti12